MLNLGVWSYGMWLCEVICMLSLCVWKYNLGVWSYGMWQCEREAAGGGGEGARDTESKTRTPHKVVGKNHEKAMKNPWKINELKSPWKSKEPRAWLLLSPFDSWRYSRKLRKRVANLSHFNFIYWFYWSTEFPGENAATHPTDVC